MFNDCDGQADIYRQVEPLATSAVNEYNATVFAFGLTGSGKPYTMMGQGSRPNIREHSDEFEKQRRTEAGGQEENFQLRVRIEQL